MSDNTKEWFMKAWPGGYKECWDGYGTNWLPDILRVIDPFSSKDYCAVEIGCGRGLFTEELAKRFKSVTALDVVPRSFRGLANSANIEHVELESCDYTCQGILDDSQDFVFSFGCFCHLSLSAQAQYIASIYRILKPGRVAIIMVADWVRHPGLVNSSKNPEKWSETMDSNGWYYNLFEITDKVARACGFVDVQDTMPSLRDPLVKMTK